MIPILATLLAAVPLSLGTGTNALGKVESLNVVSRRCDMDRKFGIVLFDGDARVDCEPGYTLCADRVFALFSGTNQLERLIASGRVAITNGTRVGSCDRAIFWHARGEIVMTAGKEGSLARLSDDSHNEMAGRTIRFWTKTDQVEILQSRLTIGKSGEGDALKKFR